jgi:hypothetical protein
MDRKMRSMLKGAGLQRLVGGDLHLFKGHETPSPSDKVWNGDTLNSGYKPNEDRGDTVDDFQFFWDHSSPSLKSFMEDFWKGQLNIAVDRHQNETPEEFEKTKKAMIAGLLNPKGKNGSERLKNKWVVQQLQQLPFWKSAEKYVAKDTVYRQAPMGRDQWEQDVQRNITNWKTRVDDAQLPEAKASLISEFGEYQQNNASYDKYLAMNESKPPPPSFEGKDISEVTKAVGEEDVKFDKRAKLEQLRMADDMTSHDVAQKVATLKSMKTGIPTADEEIDKTLAYIKWGEELREQIALWETAGVKKDMSLPDYYDSIGKPPLIDVEAKVAEESRQIDQAIEAYKKSPKYVWDQIKKWGLMVIDIGSNFLPYILPFPIGEVISLGYQAFAPQGSMYHTEGSFTQKLQAGLINGATMGIGNMIGLGRTGRRKYMKTLMAEEGGGAKAPALQIEDEPRSRHALHAKTPVLSQRRRKPQRQT